jgi:hypothetical protein
VESEERAVELRCSVITTTTRAEVHRENASRIFDLWIDESQALTEDVLREQARRQMGEVDANAEELIEVWQAALGQLERMEVVVRFADKIAAAFPSESVRSRRDHPKVYALIRASTLLHQRQRDRDGDGRLIASTEDYRLVLPLLQRALTQSAIQLSDRARDLCALLDELAGGRRDGWVMRAELEAEAHRRRVASRNTVHDWCRRLARVDIWQEERLDSEQLRYRKLRDLTELFPLPHPDEL